MTKNKSAAILTIRDAPNMSQRGRNSVASWLERQAGFLRNNAKQLSQRFTARYLYILFLALLVSGCKSPVIPPALVQSGVASSVRYGVTKHPTARPAVTVGVEVICSVANGTNLEPAVIIAAVEASNFATLKTPAAEFIMDGIITAYTYVWNSYGAPAVENAPVFKVYVQAVCTGGTEGLGALKASPSDYQWPHLK